MPKKPITDIDQTPEGCWVWRGPRDAYGKPITSIKGRVVRVQYLHFRQHYGREAAKIGTTCKRKDCVNPEHLTDLKNPPPSVSLASLRKRLVELDIILENIVGDPSYDIILKEKKQTEEKIKEMEAANAQPYNPNQSPVGASNSVQEHP
ncbi:MAG: hypothetical protein QXZ51_01400 [Candidatus Bathyarchaeia archaeon]